LAYKGRIIGIITEEKDIEGEKVSFEKALRSPGVRIIPYKDNQILLTREFRYELDDWDYRLAGGKVVDTLDEYLKIRDNKEMLEGAIQDAIKREAKEELGIEIIKTDLLKKSICGATVEWDLYYYSTDNFKDLGENSPDAGEKIEREWKSVKEVLEMCEYGRISEDRSVVALMNFINDKKWE